MGKLRVVNFEALLDCWGVHKIDTEEDECIINCEVTDCVGRLKFRFVVLLGDVDVIIGVIEATDAFLQYFVSLFLGVMFVVFKSHELWDYFSLGFEILVEMHSFIS